MPEPQDDDEAADDEGARPFWSGTISFGLVSVPVQLLTAHRTRPTALRTLAPDGAPLRREYVCPADDQVLGPDDLVRGVELEDGSYVTIADEELLDLQPERTRDIDLRRFVPREEVDPTLFQRAFYLAPGEGSVKAYRLLAATLEASGRLGIATFVLRGQERLLAISAAGGVLHAEVLRFADELRPPEAAGLPVQGTPDRALLGRLRDAIERGGLDALPGDVVADEAATKLHALAARKREAGDDVVEAPEADVPAEAAPGPEVDIVEVLRRSLRDAVESRDESSDAEDGPEAGTKRARRRRSAASPERSEGRARATSERPGRAARSSGTAQLRSTPSSSSLKS